MLIVAGTIRVEADHRDALFAAVAPMVEATRAEPGCQAYDFTPDPNEPDLVHIYELWDDQAALDGHFASAHMAAWREAAAELPVNDRNLSKYMISESSPLA